MYHAINKYYYSLKMSNSIKNWFFDLIEDAIGSKAMEQFKKEEEEKASTTNKKPSKKDL